MKGQNARALHILSPTFPDTRTAPLKEIITRAKLSVSRRCVNARTTSTAPSKTPQTLQVQVKSLKSRAKSEKTHPENEIKEKQHVFDASRAARHSHGCQIGFSSSLRRKSVCSPGSHALCQRTRVASGPVGELKNRCGANSSSLIKSENRDGELPTEGQPSSGMRIRHRQVNKRPVEIHNT